MLGLTDDQDFTGAFADYGRHLGIAFQLIDDVLDYQGDASELGKNVGDDLAEGKPTLPLIHTIANGSEAQAKLIKDAIRSGGLDHLQEIVETVRASGGLQYTVDKAAEHTRLALNAIADVPSSPYKEALIRLAEESLKRTY